MSKIPELNPQWQAFALEFLEVGMTKDFATWANLCNRVGVALLAPKTLALEGEAGTPVEVEGHREGKGNADEPAATAQGADETEDEPNGEDEGEDANGDAAGGNVNAAGVILPELETQSLVAGTEGDHANLNGHNFDTLSLLQCKPTPATPSGRPTLEKMIASARRLKHASAVAVRFAPSSKIRVECKGCVHEEDAVKQGPSLSQGFNRHVDYVFELKMGAATWMIERSYQDIKVAYEHLQLKGRLSIGVFKLGQPPPSHMAEYLEAVLGCNRAWQINAPYIVDLCNLRPVYEMYPPMHSVLPRFPRPTW
jgi:hypothetical protein